MRNKKKKKREHPPPDQKRAVDMGAWMRLMDGLNDLCVLGEQHTTLRAQAGGITPFDGRSNGGMVLHAVVSGDERHQGRNRRFGSGCSMVD